MEPETPSPHYNGFWPVFLIGMSMVLIFVWEIQVSVFTRRNAVALKDQQVKVVDEAKKVQGELEKIARGLIELSKTDAKAQQIVTKFGIKVNNPTVPTETPAP